MTKRSAFGNSLRARRYLRQQLATSASLASLSVPMARPSQPSLDPTGESEAAAPARVERAGPPQPAPFATVRLWEVATGKPGPTIDESLAVTAVASALTAGDSPREPVLVR